jgi:hypothetical protein
MSRKKLPITIIAFIVSVFLYAACGGSSEVGGQSVGPDCQAIIDVKCVKCHYKTRICDALGTKSKRKWKRTIKFMVRQGANLTQDEQKNVAECLSRLPKGSDVVCK